MSVLRSCITSLATIMLGALTMTGPVQGASVDLSGTLVVVNQASDTVTLVDVGNMVAYRHVPVVGGPHEAAVSPDGKRVIVTNYYPDGAPGHELSLISLPDGELIRHVSIGKYRAPHDVHWVDDTRVVSTAESSNALVMVNVDNGEIERVFETGIAGSHMLALANDHKRIYSEHRKH